MIPWMFGPISKPVAVEVTRLTFLFVLILAWTSASATPANKAALGKYYGQYLPTNLNSCTTCHLPSKLDHPPENLDEFPHNAFGKRLRALGQELQGHATPNDTPRRQAMTGTEEADGDGPAQ